MNDESVLLKDEVFQIMGAAFSVYNELKSGFAESVYQEAMELELGDRTIPFARQVQLQIRYKHHVLKRPFIADLICFGSVLVELKAISQTSKADTAK